MTGAGDTVMDRFLAGVGLSVHVGPIDLPFEGLCQTVKLRDSNELGELLSIDEDNFANDTRNRLSRIGREA